MKTAENTRTCRLCVNPNGQVLYVTARNVAEPSGEWNLIATRAHALYLMTGIRTRILAITKGERMVPSRMAPAVEGVAVDHFCYESLIGSLGASIHAMRTAQLIASKNDCIAIVVSGVHSELMAASLSRWRAIPLIVDMHAVVDEWLDYPRQFARHPLLLKMFVRTMKSIRRRAVKKSSAIIAVSGPLIEYSDLTFGVKTSFKIPCGVMATMPINDMRSNREKWRGRLGLHNELVVAYSGGLSSWQLVRESCQMFLGIKEYRRDSKLLLLTSDTQEALAIADSVGVRESDIVATRVQPTEVIPALCAADIGLLLRRDNLTNWVAFPNKFAEYVSGGLIIVTSPGLVEPSDIVREFRLGLVVPPAGCCDPHLAGELLAVLARREHDIEAYWRDCHEAINQTMLMIEMVKPMAEYLGRQENCRR